VITGQFLWIFPQKQFGCVLAPFAFHDVGARRRGQSALRVDLRQIGLRQVKSSAGWEPEVDALTGGGGGFRVGSRLLFKFQTSEDNHSYNLRQARRLVRVDHVKILLQLRPTDRQIVNGPALPSTARNPPDGP